MLSDKGQIFELQNIVLPVLIFCTFSWQAFELATGDFLFEPHSGEDYTRDEGNSQNNVFHTLVKISCKKRKNTHYHQCDSGDT